jgi:hypothetical protein
MTAPEIERQERLLVTAADGTTHRFYTHDEVQAAIAEAMQGAEVSGDIVATIKAKMFAEKYDIDTAEGRANFDAALRRHLKAIKDKWIKANAVELLRRWRWELFDEGYQYGATADEVRALRERISALEAQLDISSPAPREIKTLRRKGREGEVK